MADKGHQGFAGIDEEQAREAATEGGHASHERGAANEFSHQGAVEAGRKGGHMRAMANADAEAGGDEGQTESGEEVRTKRTRGGTHTQHVTAGKKGGSRIRQLIELGYKYEQEHGIGPGQNERSKLAAKRRAKSNGADDAGEAGS